MESLIYIYIFNVFTAIAVAGTVHRNITCGKDNSPIDVVFEGVAKPETYPWLGYLVYETRKQRFTTVVVLVTKQIVLGTAIEIEKLPKIYFRSHARVVLGTGCLGTKYRVRDYIYHPDYTSESYNALAMVQLDLDGVKIETLHPICPPPFSMFIEAEFYAMTLSNDCKNPKVRVYEMEFLDSERCKSYYRRSGLDISTLWPVHTACAQAKQGGECVWRSGAALAVYQWGRWHLIGFGVYGPGCKAPARFLDYGMYQQWVRQNVLRIGRPTITRIGESKVILRRSLTNLQRFGHCDAGEMRQELYTDETKINLEKKAMRKVTYNMSIYATIEYSCVMFSATNYSGKQKKPQLRLRRWCTTNENFCSDYSVLQIDFYVEVTFFGPVKYELKAYGKKISALDINQAMVFINSRSKKPYIP